MEDLSFYDDRYFMDAHTYNCPFCNRNNVPYRIISIFNFDWTSDKSVTGITVQCSFCNHKSMHLSYNTELLKLTQRYYFSDNINDIDNEIFYSHPTSFFVLDERIPKEIRELIIEADGCRKMNLLTGASACLRKAIYEFLKREGAEGSDYDEKIKSLKSKFPYVDEQYFIVLSHIKDMTSNKVHELSWEKWSSKHVTLFIQTLKTILQEIYVIPEMKKGQSNKISTLLNEVFHKKTS